MHKNSKKLQKLNTTHSYKIYNIHYCCYSRIKRVFICTFVLLLFIPFLCLYPFELPRNRYTMRFYFMHVRVIVLPLKLMNFTICSTVFFSTRSAFHLGSTFDFFSSVILQWSNFFFLIQELILLFSVNF